MGGEATTSLLPVLLALGPMLAAVAVPFIGRRNEGARNAYVVVVVALALLGSAALVPLVRAHERLVATLPLMLGRLTFVVDPFALLFALLVPFVWFAATLYSLDYLRHEEHRDRYHVANLVALGAMLGVVLAGDLITLYLFFEVLGLIAFLLVIHTETTEAKAASIKYAWMTIIGGFALLGGIFLAGQMGPTGLIAPLPSAALEAAPAWLRWGAVALLVLGFGVKAGMLPVHVWLPEAHPVAPSPASALLSGVMIKAGAYGIFRVITALFRPPIAEQVSEELWHFTNQIGLVVLWIGIVTMLLGVAMALLQSNAKRMLAYHSVSQMGFILTGLGAAGYLGAEASVGIAGGLYHVLNHALFKALLFLGVGAVYVRTHELNMYELGGLWRRMPVTFLFTLVAAFGISGIPLFNGFASKTLIHHALIEAQAAQGLFSLVVAEKVFILTCGGTVCSFVKLMWFVFLRRPTVERPVSVEASPRMLAGMGMLAVPIVLIGLFPHFVVDRLLIPGMELWGFEPGVLPAVEFFAPECLIAAAWALAIGFTLFFVGVSTGLFHLHPPAWLSIDWYYGRVAQALGRASRAIAQDYESMRSGTSEWLDSASTAYFRVVRRAHRTLERISVLLLTGGLAFKHRAFLDEAYVRLLGEREDAVRNASYQATAAAQMRGLGREDRSALESAARELSVYGASRLLRVRMETLVRIIEEEDADAVRSAFVHIMPTLEAADTRIVDASVRLAESRMRGENVVRPLSAVINRATSEECFEQRLREALPSRRTATAIAEFGETAPRVAEEGKRVLGAYAQRAKAGAAVARGFARDVFALAADSAARERVPWMVEERVGNQRILSTRRAIRVYARDLSLNAFVIAVALLAFVLVLLLTQ